MTQLHAEIRARSYVWSASRSVDDHVVYQSHVEWEFVEGLKKRDGLTLYLKPLSRFKVLTPGPTSKGLATGPFSVRALDQRCLLCKS
jgi:hypothetical protein